MARKGCTSSCRISTPYTHYSMISLSFVTDRDFCHIFRITTLASAPLPAALVGLLRLSSCSPPKVERALEEMKRKGRVPPLAASASGSVWAPT